MKFISRRVMFRRMTGNDLKQRRGGLGLSQEGLARALEVALSTVARWEQLKDELIPNSAMLDLALEALEARAKLERKGRKR